MTVGNCNDMLALYNCCWQQSSERWVTVPTLGRRRAVLGRHSGDVHRVRGHHHDTGLALDPDLLDARHQPLLQKRIELLGRLPGVVRLLPAQLPGAVHGSALVATAGASRRAKDEDLAVPSRRSGAPNGQVTNRATCRRRPIAFG